MLNFITNTAIVNESWNARGLITHNAHTKALIRADDGTLWAAVREGHVKEYINVYRSVDNGFSWQNMFAGDFLETTRRTGVSGLNHNGPFIFLTLNEERQRLILWHMFYDLAEAIYDMEPFIFEISGNGLTRLTESSDYAVTGIALDADFLAVDVSYTTNHIYLLCSSLSGIEIKVYNHTYLTSVDGAETDGFNYFNVFSTYANDNNTLDIAIIRGEDPDYGLEYISWNRQTGVFEDPVQVTNFPIADVADMNIERDGHGDILIAWNQESADGTNITQRYALSTDNGDNWTIEDIPLTQGQTNYTDPATGRLAGRVVTLGGLQGFVLGYVRDLDGVPAAFIRTLLLEDGEHVLSDEYLAVDQSVTGIRFFRPTNNQLTDLDQLGQIRIAYQVGEATSQVQVDLNPVKFGQQLLIESAAFQEAEFAYEEDDLGVGEMLIYINFLGSLDSNIDYYAEGIHGNNTRKYLAAFNKVGNALTFLKYEPTPEAESSDRSAYGNPTAYNIKAVIQPQSYDFPVSSGSDSFTTMVERDQRKVHLPPDFHLSRTFLVNAGNHLKRTVWIFRFDGNEYEVSQVVPRFIKDEIVYYEANAYVVGPSNNPFSRVILPSET